MMYFIPSTLPQIGQVNMQAMLKFIEMYMGKSADIERKIHAHLEKATSL